MFKKPKRKLYALIFVLPTFAAFVIGFIYPFFRGIYLSFFQFQIVSKTKFVGFDNYIRAFQDESFLRSFWFTLGFVVVSVILINLIAFFVAYALTLKIRGSNVFRTVFFMPNLIGGIILGYIWHQIFDGLLRNLDMPSLVTNETLGFWGLVILMCWQQAGYMMIIYIAGFQSVPADLYEAAVRSRKDRRREQGTAAHKRNAAHDDALDHDLQLPHAHQLLQAVRPEPRAHRRRAAC